MGSYSPDAVRRAITARILALEVVKDATTIASTERGYAHATTDAWREAEEPLIPEAEPATRAHLAFFVDDRDLVDLARTRSTIGDEPYVVGPLTIRFLAAMRSMVNRKADWDRAVRAARALLRHLLSEGAWADDFTVQRPSSGALISRRPISTPDFLSVEVRLDVLFFLSLAE